MINLSLFSPRTVLFKLFLTFELIQVFVDNSQGQKIKIQLFDEDKASDDEKLGSVEADISTVVQQGNADLWLPLENVESGQINLRCVWYTLTSNPDDLSPVR
jgi:Ca2+-dependent lipid-binding protein